MRDKLIGLLLEVDSVCDVGDCSECSMEDCFIHRAADNLIANGVTFATDNNVPCKYCKEDKDGYRAMFGAFSLYNPFHGSEWLIQTGHFKPRQIYFCPMCGRKLTEPPKEGE